MDADSALYDAACEVLDRARQLRETAADPACGPGVPATLGCLAATLQTLAETCDALGCGEAASAPRDEALVALGDDLSRAARLADAVRDRRVGLR